MRRALRSPARLALTFALAATLIAALSLAAPEARAEHSAAITATTPETLTEESLDGAVLEVTLTGTVIYDRPANQNPGIFPTDFILLVDGLPASAVLPELAIASVQRVSDTVAAVTLSFARASVGGDRALSIQVRSSALEPWVGLHWDAGVTTDPVTIHAAVEGDPPSSNARLAALTVLPDVLDPPFAPETTAYTASVGGEVESIDVAATPEDPAATLTIDGEASAGGAAHTILLAHGLNEIAVRVTAEDGATVRVYLLTVTRAPPDTVPPVVTPPPPLTIEVAADGLPGHDHPAVAAFLAGATASDDVDGDVSPSLRHDAPALFPFCTTTVTFSAVDAAGNEGTAASTVTVLPAPPAVEGAAVLVEDGFEAGGSAWLVIGGAMATDGSLPVCEGAAAAHLTSQVAGSMSMRTRYWLAETGPGAQHWLSLLLRNDDPAIEKVRVHIEFLDDQGLVIDDERVDLTGRSPDYRPVTLDAVAQDAASAFVQVKVVAFGPTGSAVSVDAVRLVRGPIPPPPAPTPTPTPGPGEPPGGAPVLDGALFNGGFEETPGLLGWVVRNGSATVEPRSGGQAALLATANDGTAWIEQLTRVEGGRWYEARAFLAPDGGAEAALVRIAWYASADGSGSQMATVDSPLLPGGSSAIVATGPKRAPADARSARVRLMLRPLAGSTATMLIDDASFGEVDAPPPPSSPPSSPPSGGSGAGAGGPASATGPVLPLRDALFNGDFSEGNGLLGWRKQGGDFMVRPRPGGEGYEGVLVSSTSSTKWIEQLALVDGGGWYEAAAELLPDDGVAAAWVRIAWYESADGSGRQMSTVDSPTVGSAGLRSDAPAAAAGQDAGEGGAVRVSTGPVQAPPEARSARVRVMLRPRGAGRAELVIRNVSLAPAARPPSSPAAESGSPEGESAGTPGGAAAGAPAGASPSPGARGGRARPAPPPGSSSPGGETAPQALRLPREVLAAAQSRLRITELLPDPEEPGIDGEYEWVEITNFGPRPAPLLGLLLRDNHGDLALPDLDLPPGASIVVAGPRARIGGALAFYPAGGIGNGLANEGDRLQLLSADGGSIDALSYGDDATFPPPGAAGLPAPRPGQTIERRFDAAGALVEVLATDAPTPGVAAPVQPAEPGGSGRSGESDETERPAIATTRAREGEWLLLFAAAFTGLAYLLTGRVRPAGAAARPLARGVRSARPT